MSRREEIARQRNALTKARRRRQGWTDTGIVIVIDAIIYVILFSLWNPPLWIVAIVAIAIMFTVMGLVALWRKLSK